MFLISFLCVCVVTASYHSSSRSKSYVALNFHIFFNARLVYIVLLLIYSFKSEVFTRVRRAFETTNCRTTPEATAVNVRVRLFPELIADLLPQKAYSVARQTRGTENNYIRCHRHGYQHIPNLIF